MKRTIARITAITGSAHMALGTPAGVGFKSGKACAVLKEPKPTASRRRTKKLLATDKARIVQARQDGKTFSAIAKMFGVSTSTVASIYYKYQLTGTVEHKKGAGRPRKTTPQDDRYLVQMMKRDRTITAHELQERGNLQNVSLKTVRRRLRESGEFQSYWQTKKPYISEKNRKKRLAWAKKHKDWTKEDWSRVLWSDESPFVLRFNRRQRVWRRANERYIPEAIRSTVKHDKKINVWGCFCAHGVGKLYLVNGILDQKQYKQMLIHQAQPSARKLFNKEKWIFQQDNDPKHTAKTVKAYLKNKKWRVLDWPAQSPDLNPIENLWSILDYKMKDRKPQNEKQLFEVLKETWENLDPLLLMKLVDSMPARCRAVIKARGGHTKY